ncbi:MAG: aspartate aminotransferase family protein, partial [Paracoccaceae bacterium]
RGSGLFFGVEFMKDGAPAAEFTGAVVEGMRREGVLLGRIGRHGNVLKLRPPMPFSRADADFALEALERVLKAVPA